MNVVMEEKEDIQPISAAEWRIMARLWERSPQSAQEIIAGLSPDTGWKPTTVKTLLGRLVKKGVLGFSEHNRQYEYAPLVDEATCRRRETRSFVDKVFAGGMDRMLVGFVQDANLSPAQLADLRDLLDRKIRESGDR
jgi:BlaI family penicillinase repressor